MTAKDLAEKIEIANAKTIIDLRKFAYKELNVLTHANYKSASYNDVKWPDRKKPDHTRALLVQTGEMRRSLRTQIVGDTITTTLHRTNNHFNVAQAHHEGIGKMPKRQVIPTPGTDAALLKKIDREAIKLYNKHFAN